MDLHRQLLLEDVALAAVVIARLRLTYRLCRHLVASHAQLRRGAEPHLLLAVRLERVLREHPVGARLQQVQQAQEHLLHLPLTPPPHAYQMRAPVAALAREQERLLRLLRGRGRCAVRALAPLQHVLGVEAQEQEQVPRGVATDAVGQRVDPEGVAVLRQELALQRRQHLQGVVDGVGAEKGRERGLPHVQTGAAQLCGELGLAGHRLGGVETVVVHAVEQVGGQRQHAVEKGHLVHALRISASSLADLSLEEAAQVERGSLQRGEVREVEREEREEAVHVQQVEGGLLRLVLLVHELGVRRGRGRHRQQRVELELQDDGRGVQPDVRRGRLQLAVVDGEAAREGEGTNTPGDLDQKVGEVQVPVEGELLAPALRVGLVDRRQLRQDLVERVCWRKRPRLEKGLEEEGRF